MLGSLWRVLLCLSVAYYSPLGAEEPGHYFPPLDKDGGWRALTMLDKFARSREWI